MKIALKVLTPSDLSLFKAHQRLSRQRALSLDDEVFIERFYPGLQGSRGPVIFPLVVIGPGGRGAHRLMRMATRSPGVKHWHIKGEPIHEPAEEPRRYEKLTENDFAIIVFEGHERPKSVTLILISAAEDAELHATLADRCEPPAPHTLRELSETSVAHLLAQTLGAYTHNAHPLEVLSSRDTVEDVLFGTGASTPPDERPSSLPVAVSPEELRGQLLAAAETGQRGEELFGSWLTAVGHEEDDFRWVSQTHARSAHDYEVLAARWLEDVPHVFVAVKTTRAPFAQPLHMGIAELRFAADTENYRIARLYNIDGTTPKLRILTGVQPVAAQLIGALGALPDGVTADSLRINPGMFEVELEASLR